MAFVHVEDRRLDAEPAQRAQAADSEHELLPDAVLAEIPVPVEEADRRQRDAELRRRLQVIAREHAEAAGVDREALVEPELRREVRDAEPLVLPALLPPRRPLELEAERVEDALYAL